MARKYEEKKTLRQQQQQKKRICHQFNMFAFNTKLNTKQQAYIERY